MTAVLTLTPAEEIACAAGRGRRGSCRWALTWQASASHPANSSAGRRGHRSPVDLYPTAP